jgi:hypothetical protein
MNTSAKRPQTGEGFDQPDVRPYRTTDTETEGGSYESTR